MAKDAELERLAQTQEQAFRGRHDAYEAMQRAWERRLSARDVMNRAFEANQDAYDAMQQAWHRYQSVRQANGPRIDVLNAQQETAYQNMKRSFEAASSAYERRDGASAKSLADDGRRYKAEAQQSVTERRRLVEEIKAARPVHETAKAAFERAKEAFRTAKEAHNRAKLEHERAQADFKKCKAAADEAKQAFHKRLEWLKAQGKQRQDDKRAIAEKAGVPYQYRDNVWVSVDSEGNTNIYFGGLGKPNGPGHGHYVVDRNVVRTYSREPFDPHGEHNFEKADLYMRSARRDHEPLGTNEHGGVFYRRDDTGGTILHITQYFSDGFHVSWDATPFGNRNVHWTNQNVPDGHPERFIAPPDALFR